MNYIKKFFIALLSIVLIFHFILGTISIYATSTTGLTNDQKEEYRDTIKRVAYAYYRKGTAIQYDQKRRDLNAKPEDAKENWPLYLDCSSFVYNVYRQAFNIELQAENDSSLNLISTQKMLEEAYTKRKKTNYIVYYKGPTAMNNLINTSTYEKTKFANDVKKSLEVGDLIVYHKDIGEGHGHVMLYIGNDKLMHCRGSQYNYKYKEDSIENNERPAIEILDIKSLFENVNYYYNLDITKKSFEKDKDALSNRNIFYDNTTKFAVIRPLEADYMKNAKLSKYSEARNSMTLLDVQLNSSIGHLKTINPGATITYTLVLKSNYEKTSLNLDINLVPSKYLTDVQLACKTDENNNDRVEDGSKITINPNEILKIDYKAKVTTNNINKKITTYATIHRKYKNSSSECIDTNKIVHTIGRTLKASEKNKIISVVKLYISKSEYSGKTRNLIDDIYKDALGVDCGFSSITTESMFNNIMRKIEIKNDKIEYKIELESNNTETRKMLLEDLYGYNLKDYKKDNLTGVRNLHTNNLITGDVIIYTYKEGTTDKYGIYFYIAEDTLIGVSNNKVIVKKDVQRELDKLLGQDKFAVLRPSLIMNE